MARWLTRSVVAWALYDVASSAYAALVPTLFGVFFVTVVAGDVAGAQAQWGITAAIALVLSGILSPVVGAWSDRKGNRIGTIALATGLCVCATLLMPTGAYGRIAWMVAVFVAAQVGYTLATALYDSLLVTVAPRDHAGRVSGFGWAMGFLGGLLSLAAALVLIRQVPPEAQAALLPHAFLVAGVMYAILAVPGLRALRSAGARPGRSTQTPGVANALAAVVATVRQWRRQREVFRFLIAFYLINDVLVTLVFFIAIVARSRFGFSIEGLLWLAALYHVVAMPATIAFGHAADRWGQRRTIVVMTVILAAALILLAFGGGTGVAVTVVIMLALVWGSMQAVCRSLLALLVQPGNAAETFGFNAIAGRLSAALGPLLFGVVVAASGSDAAALLSLLPFLVAGVAVLGTIRMPGARIAGDGAAASAPGSR